MFKLNNTKIYRLKNFIFTLQWKICCPLYTILDETVNGKYQISHFNQTTKEINSFITNTRNDSRGKSISTFETNKKQNLLKTFDNWIEYKIFKKQLNLDRNSYFFKGKYFIVFSINRQFHKSSCLYSTIKTDSERKYYDYIIIGAGTAGCVLANRLTVNKHISVNLLEAGPVDNALTIKIPACLMFNLQNDRYNWYYNTKPQQHLNGRNIYCPIGRVIGGSSSLNAMIYMRGHPYDYDRWEKEGAIGWSYSSCLPYFKKSQKHELGENVYRGGNGPLYVERTKHINELHHLWINAGIQAGHSFTDDMNGFQQEGIGEFDLNIHKGERWSVAKAFLEPAMKNHNLKVTTGALVTKILFEGKRAIGVEVLNKKKKLEKIMINKEIILCGGSIHSPRLLMLSGVGDGNELKNQSIEVIEHIPNVGKNLQDHLVVAIQHKCKKPISLYKHPWIFPFSVMKSGIEWLLFRSGIGSTSHVNSGGFIRSESNILHPDIQFHFFPVIVVDHGRDLPTFHSFQAYAGNLRTQSRGQITLQSNDPRKYPIIDPNYCSHYRDFSELRIGIRECRKIFSQQSFEEVIGEEVAPGIEIQSENQLNEFIKRTSCTMYHPTSTCRMGTSNDNSTVVDPECRVVGIDNLRVVDASIMPSLISGNTNAPVIMIAEKAADIILGNPPLPKMENVPIWKHV